MHEGHIWCLAVKHAIVVTYTMPALLAPWVGAVDERNHGACRRKGASSTRQGRVRRSGVHALSGVAVVGYASGLGWSSRAADAERWLAARRGPELVYVWGSGRTLLAASWQWMCCRDGYDLARARRRALVVCRRSVVLVHGGPGCPS